MSRRCPILLVLQVAALLGGSAAARAAGPAPVANEVAPAPRYELGHGLRLGESGFTLGGYGEVSYRHVDDGAPDALVADALSAMLWWDGKGSLHFFSETELADGLRLQDGRSATGGARVVSERLYVDWTPRDEVKVRAGKFLTPVGRWNVIHAAPLTWTTSRPLITSANFPTNATGLMVYGTLPWTAEGIEYAVYGSTGDELLENDDLDTFTEAIGARLSTKVLPTLDAGLSAVSYEQESESEVRKRLLGADFAWSWRRFEVSGEFAWRALEGSDFDDDEQGLYVQFVAPLAQHWYAVARYERVHAGEGADDFNLYLGGIDWRPLSALTLKAEFSQATDNGPGVEDGVRASIAVLF